MKEPIYRGSVLKHNSKAFELWEMWQKTKDAKDRSVLDQHLRELVANEEILLNRYPNTQPFKH